MSYDYEAWQRRKARMEVGMATTPREELHRELQKPEFRRLYGAALAKSGLAVALGQAIEKANDLTLTEVEVIQRMGISARMYIWLLRGDANPKIGDLGKWLAGMGWQLKMSIEPLEQEGQG